MLTNNATIGTLVKVRYHNYFRLGIIEGINQSMYSVSHGFKVSIRFTDNKELRQYDRWDTRIEEINSPVEIASIKQYEFMERNRAILPSERELDN